MNIRQTFLQLTKKTYPHGTEYLLIDHLPEDVQQDEFGNYYIEIGNQPRTMFACHLDTVSSEIKDVKHVFDGKYIKTDGTTILGADDKAGMCVILSMIEKNIPGLYYFFIGEEVGCIGSNQLAKLFKTTEHGLDRVISFDRRGTKSVITHQLFGRCCSDEFAMELASRLNDHGLDMELDPTGVSTDSACFMDFIPECTNISVGYYKEHTYDEYQDIEFLKKICDACCKIDWESLPVKRDPNKEDYYDYDYFKYGQFFDGSYSEEPKKKNYTYIIDDHGDSVKAYISNYWIDREKAEIYKMLKLQGSTIEALKWDGTDCYIQTEEGAPMEFLGNRSSLITFIPNLSSIPYCELEVETKK